MLRAMALKHRLRYASNQSLQAIEPQVSGNTILPQNSDSNNAGALLTHKWVEIVKESSK